jgi:catechol 2,3-dioxygenase-like lactoylglutathione lyase family enzyme
VEIADWDELIANLDNLGVPYTTTPGMRHPSGESSWGKRDYSDSHYTYVHDPDGNMIELVKHPLGMEDAAGNEFELAHHQESPSWRRFPQYNTVS